jgi:hypothetical protein
MTSNKVSCLYTCQVALGVAHTIVIPVHIADTPDMLPLATTEWTLVTNLFISRQTLQAPQSLTNHLMIHDLR